MLLEKKKIKKILNLMLELYVMKVTRIVLRGGMSRKGRTYLNRP